MPSWRPISRSGVGSRAGDPVAQLDDRALAVGQLAAARAAAPPRAARCARRPRAPARRTGSRSPNAASSLLAQRAVERRHRARGVAQRVQVLDRDLGLLGDLGVGRRAVELERQRVLGARDLALGAHEVDRQLDRARLGVHPALDGLADPPRRVGREAVAAAPVELLDRADQPEDALLDQVEQRQLGALVLLRDRDDEPQVRVDHAVLGGEVAALDALGEVDLLGRRQQPVAADLVEEELQRVGRDGRELRRRRPAPRRVLAAAVVAQLDAARVQLLVEAAEIGVLELERLGELVDLREVDAAALLSPVDRARRAGPPSASLVVVITVNVLTGTASDETSAGPLVRLLTGVARGTPRARPSREERAVFERFKREPEGTDRTDHEPRATAANGARRPSPSGPRRPHHRDGARPRGAPARATSATRAARTARRRRRRRPGARRRRDRHGPAPSATPRRACTTARARQRDEFGGINWGAALLRLARRRRPRLRCSSAILAAAGAAVGLTQNVTETDATGNAEDARPRRRASRCSSC